jgi:hypothetical protein
MNGVTTKRKDYQRKFKFETVFLGLLCITELTVLCLGAACDVTDGSKANSVACTCGSVECTNTTGFICFSTYGGGSCRKTGLGPFGYTKETQNHTNCGSVSNRGSILDKASCEAAARSMDLDDVKASVVQHFNSELESMTWPPGCIWGGDPVGRLWYNTLITSSSSCDGANSEYCLCIAAPDCTHTNGVTSNTDACLCGGAGCTAVSGLYCYASNSQCSLVAIPDCLTTDGSAANGAACTCSSSTCTAASGLVCNVACGISIPCYPYDSRTQKQHTCSYPHCEATDGSVANEAACTCGTGRATCTAASGRYCYASNSQCSFVAIPDCLTTDGSAANGAACTCGSVECTSTTGLICYLTYGSGSCRRTGFGDYGYVREYGHKMCGDVSNRKPILDIAGCKAAATSMGLDITGSIEHRSDSNYPPGCFVLLDDRSGPGYKLPKLYYNSLFTSTASCNLASSSLSSCLCIRASNCTQTNGMTSNTDACLCGATGCTEASGLFCDASTFYGHCSTASKIGSLIGTVIVFGIGLFFVVFICYRFWKPKRSSNYAISQRGPNVAWHGKPTRSSNNMASTDSAATFASASAELEAIFARDSMGDGDKQREQELVAILKQFSPIPVSPDSNASRRTESISVSVSDSAVSSKEIEMKNAPVKMNVHLFRPPAI